VNGRVVPPATKAVVEELTRLDQAVYETIAVVPTPVMDQLMRRLSRLADKSKLWLTIAGAIGLLGGRTGRRTAAGATAAVGVNSAVVNVILKVVARRARPDRRAAQVPIGRHVPMPTSKSFPSGHTASGFAFAAALGGTTPALAAPMRLLATVVGYSRVHAGVHYPGDVVVGALVGTTIGETVAFVVRARVERQGKRSSRSIQRNGGLRHVLSGT
jgi:membrane-associated phospholipid phosphatase